MRKRLIAPIPQDAPALDEGWLDLDDAAVVEKPAQHLILDSNQTFVSCVDNHTKRKTTSSFL